MYLKTYNKGIFPIFVKWILNEIGGPVYVTVASPIYSNPPVFLSSKTFRDLTVQYKIIRL
jgi:hypothetical protein